jgi:hypothetical protein
MWESPQISEPYDNPFRDFETGVRKEKSGIIYQKLRNVIQDPQHLTHIVIQLKACLVLVKE